MGLSKGQRNVQLFPDTFAVKIMGGRLLLSNVSLSVSFLFSLSSAFLHLAQHVPPECEIGRLDLHARTIKDLREEPALHPSEICEHGLINYTEIQPGLDKSRVYFWSSPILTHTAVCSRDPPGLSELGWSLYLL